MQIVQFQILYKNWEFSKTNKLSKTAGDNQESVCSLAILVQKKYGFSVWTVRNILRRHIYCSYKLWKALIEVTDSLCIFYFSEEVSFSWKWHHNGFIDEEVANDIWHVRIPHSYQKTWYSMRCLPSDDFSFKSECYHIVEASR